MIEQGLEVDRVDYELEAKEKAVHTLWSVGTTPEDVLARRLAELDTMRPTTQESQPESIAEDEATHGAYAWVDCGHCRYGGHACDRN